MCTVLIYTQVSSTRTTWKEERRHSGKLKVEPKVNFTNSAVSAVFFSSNRLSVSNDLKYDAMR